MRQSGIPGLVALLMFVIIYSTVFLGKGAFFGKK
jgi:hypothetical protein